MFCSDSIGIEKHRYGFVDGSMIFNPDIIAHLYGKSWSPSVFSEMELAIACLRELLSETFFGAADAR